MVDIYEYLRYTANLISKSRFGNKMILKGGSVLISKLIEVNRRDLYRLTRDLGIHCNKKEVWVDFYTNIVDLLNKNDRGYVYKIVKRRSMQKGLEDSDSLTFEIKDKTEIIKFKVDMNLKSNAIITVNYSPILNMNTYDLETLLSDKIAAVSSEKIFRRIKDLYDIAVLASISNYSYLNVLEHLKIKHGDAKLKNMITMDNIDNLIHTYEKYEGIVNKPDIRELIAICTAFLEPFYANYNGEAIWNSQTCNWECH